MAEEEHVGKREHRTGIDHNGIERLAKALDDGCRLRAGERGDGGVVARAAGDREQAVDRRGLHHFIGRNLATKQLRKARPEIEAKGEVDVRVTQIAVE